MHSVLITKADGEREPFDPAKLEQSLDRAGASSSIRARVVDHVVRELRDGMHTEDIYRRAFELLRDEETVPVAARYSMKRAIFALGPSGFPFELFFAEILRAYGWSARADVILRGRCAQHEVDVLAEKDGRRIGVEANHIESLLRGRYTGHHAQMRHAGDSNHWRGHRETSRIARWLRV